MYFIQGSGNGTGLWEGGVNSRAAECVFAAVEHVQEAVLILVLSIKLPHCGGCPGINKISNKV